MIRVWVRVRSWDRGSVIVRVIVAVRVSKVLWSGLVQGLIWGLGLDHC